MKSTKILWFLMLTALFAPLASLSAATATFSDPRQALKTSATLPRLSIEGNRFIDPSGKTVVLRGVATSDPAALLEKGQWGRRYFEKAKEWNANVVRIPVHPADWRKLG